MRGVLSRSSLAAARQTARSTFHVAAYQPVALSRAAGALGPVETWADVGSPFSGRLGPDKDEERRAHLGLERRRTFTLIAGADADLTVSQRIRDVESGVVYDVAADLSLPVEGDRIERAYLVAEVG